MYVRVRFKDHEIWKHAIVYFILTDDQIVP